MTAKKLNQLRHEIFKNRPLIHCITNPIAINMCANAVLALGASPIMAEHPKEVQGITKSAGAVCLNLGNITDARIRSIKLSAKAAKKYGIPVVLDLVGISCSPLRRKLAAKLVKKYTPTVIKGNYSEICALFDSTYKSAGVDADTALSEEYVSRISAKLAKKYSACVLASGKTDIIADGKNMVHIKNGTPRLAAVTGTGCMLGAICACFLTVGSGINAVSAACAMLGICGELAEKQDGSFFVNLMEKLCSLSDEEFENYLKPEETEIEKS